MTPKPQAKTGVDPDKSETDNPLIPSLKSLDDWTMPEEWKPCDALPPPTDEGENG